MALSIRVKEVTPLNDMMLSVLFVNGVRKRYDVKQLFDDFGQMFLPLKENQKKNNEYSSIWFYALLLVLVGALAFVLVRPNNKKKK